MSDAPVAHAEDEARRWVRELGPGWVARFDQMHSEVRGRAAELGLTTDSYEFKATWCVATTFLHRMARILAQEDPKEGDALASAANVLSTVGLWGAGSLAP